MADPDPRPRPTVPPDAPLSGAAIMALVLAFVPFLGMFGMLLGLVAHRRITAAPTPMRGGRLAIAAMFIGCATTFLSLQGLRMWQEQLFVERDAALDTMFTTVFETVAADDAPGVVAQWVERPGALPPSVDQIADAAAWLAAHAGAYREFTLMSGTQSGSMTSGAADLSLQFRFEHGTALGAARVRLTSSPSSLTMEPKLYWLIVEHPEWGRIELGAVPSRDDETETEDAAGE